MVAVKPIEEHAEHVHFEIKRKIRKGVLLSKGSAVPGEFEPGDKVYYEGSSHRHFDGHLLMSHKSIQGHASTR